MIFKACTKCQVSKEHSEYGPNKATRDGLQSWCRECTRQHHRSKSAEAVARIREWRKANPEQARLSQRSHNHRRRAKARQNGVYQVSQDFMQRLYRQPCFYCGAKSRVEADHVIPIHRGGVHSVGNLVPACISCNRSKGDRTITEWRNAK